MDEKINSHALLEIQSLREELLSLTQTNNDLIIYKQQLDAIFDNAPVEVYLKDREGRYIRINKQFEKLFGVKNADLVGMLPANVHDPKLAASTRDHDLFILNTGKAQWREEILELGNVNQSRTLLTIKFPVFDDDGEVDGIGAIVTDITEQKHAEQRFLHIVNTIDGVVWEYDVINEEYTYVSPQAERLLGYSVKSWHQPGFWVDSMHAEDRLWAPDYSAKCREDGLDTYESEYRCISKDGRVVWCQNMVSVIREQGQVRLLRGLLLNITQRKQHEKSIRSNKNRFRIMFMSAPVGMLLVELNTTNLLEINPAYTNIVGRSVSEIKRVGWQKITHSDDLKEIIYKLEQLKLGKINHFKMLTRFIKPEGSIVWAHLTVSTIDDEGILENPQFLAILEDVTERKNFEEKIWHQANFDFLTNLPNRNMLNDRIAQTVKTARRNQSEFAVLLIDLDHFKDVNDTLGHDRGDELLVEAAKRILLCVRESDTVARVGGDEFTIILSELSGLSGVGKVAQNILDSLSEPFYLGKNTTYISASIGITLYPKDASESISLIKNADQAMYFAKEQGRNGYHFFTAAMQQSAQRRLQLVNELRDAIKNEEFVLYYQPIVELANDKIYKAEALIRWQHPKRGLVSPAEFIAVAEETRMINAIGDWVFLEAVQQSKRWRALLDKNFQINVNASPVQFENTANFSWENHLALMDISGSSIGIEITEGLLMTSDQSALHTLLEFRDAGIQVSLDDFGTGYSSLSYLRKFDIDYLKIDQSFVQNLDYDSDDLALCSAIVVMAHTLGIKVVAEGIETQLQKDLLLSINCDFGQGYLFSRPVPAHEFEKLVSKTNSSKTEIIC